MSGPAVRTMPGTARGRDALGVDVWGIVVALLTTAIGVALSPVAIIELILVLFSKRARLNGPVFLAAVMVQVFVIALVGAFVIEVAADDTGTQASTAKGWVVLVVGVLVLFLALRNWQRRADPTVPKVFDTIATMGPGAVAVLAIGAATLNPKNLVMLLAAGAQAGASGERTITIVLALVVFTVLATLPLLAAVAHLLLGGETARARLETVRSWLTANNRTIMAVTLAVIGVAIVAQGLSAV